MTPLSMRISGLPVMNRRTRIDLLVSRAMPHAASPYTTMAQRGRRGDSSSEAISAAMEPMVMPIT